MTALEAQSLCGPADVAVALVDFLQDVVALVGLARLMQCAVVLAAFADATMHQHGQVLTLDARSLGIEDEDSLNKIFQFANISGPMVLLEQFNSIFSYIDSGTSVFATIGAEKVARERRDVF